MQNMNNKETFKDTALRLAFGTGEVNEDHAAVLDIADLSLSPVILDLIQAGISIPKSVMYANQISDSANKYGLDVNVVYNILLDQFKKQEGL